MHPRSRSLLLSALLLSGCGGEPARPTLPDNPPEWAMAAASGAVSDGWIDDFADPDLPPLVAEAWRANHDLAAASARVEAARAEARIAGAESWPALSAAGEATRSRRPLPGPGGGAQIANRYSIGAQIDWEIDLWGRLRRERSASVAEAEASTGDRDAARLALAGDVARAWFAARVAAEEARLAALLGASLDDSLTTAEERYRAGIESAETVRELRSAAAAAADRSADARIRRGARVRQVEILLGRYPAGTLVPATGLPDAPTPPPAGLPAELLARRPDVRAAQARMEAAGWRSAAARANLFPRLSLTTQGGWASSELDQLLRGDFSAWSLAANLFQPIIQGGKLRANVDRQRALAEVASEGFAAVALAALGQVEDALDAARLLGERAASQERVLAEAADLRRSAEERYRAGAGDALALYAARRGELEAALRLVTLRGARLANRVDLHLALGGDAIAPAPDPEPSTVPAVEEARP